MTRARTWMVDGRGAGALLVALLLSALGCESRRDLDFEKVHVARLPATYRRGTATTSPDGTRWTCVDQNRGNERVLNDGVPGPLFTVVGAPRFAPQGGLLAYFATSGSTAEKRVVLVGGGKVVPTDLTTMGSIYFGPDGTRWGAVAWEGKEAEGDEPATMRAEVWIDGEGPLRYRDASGLSFSHDGKHVAYIVREEDGRVALVVDGAVAKRYPDPEVGCAAPHRATAEGSAMLNQFGTVYLADDSLFVVTRDASCWSVWRGDTKLASYQNSYVHDPTAFIFDPAFGARPAIWPASLKVADDAPVVVWWERLAGEADMWRLVRDGVPVDDATCLATADGTPIALSPDGKHAVYTCAQNEENHLIYEVVHDGAKEGHYRFLYGLAISGDGLHHAYAASFGKDDPWRFYRDGKLLPGAWDHVFPPVLSADGLHVAWAATEQDRLALVFDGHEFATVDEALRPPRFTAKGTLVWPVRRVRRIVRLTMRGFDSDSFWRRCKRFLTGSQ